MSVRLTKIAAKIAQAFFKTSIARPFPLDKSFQPRVTLSLRIVPYGPRWSPRLALEPHKILEALKKSLISFWDIVAMETLRISVEDYARVYSSAFLTSNKNLKNWKCHFYANLIGFKTKYIPLLNSFAFKSYSYLVY